ncbi:MAG: type VI secretion system ATPase TssH, partial [Parcubacteria group bacterium]|nr:type VI secretion system ATPase TssH [Parcubacteria group bacterium]
VELELAKVEGRLAAQNIELEATEKAKALLAQKGFDPNLGARPLRRVIQRLVLDPLSLKIVAGEIPAGVRVVLDEKDEAIVFQGLDHLVSPLKKKTARVAV